MRDPAFAAILLAAAMLAPAAGCMAAQISVEHAWSRATAGPEMPGAIFVTIHGGAAPDQLVGVTTPVAKRAMLHRMDMGGGMMRMQMVSSMPVPAGDTVTLGPEGDHVMLTGLSEAFRRGETFPAVFHFQHGGDVAATVRIAGPGAAAVP